MERAFQPATYNLSARKRHTAMAAFVDDTACLAVFIAPHAQAFIQPLQFQRFVL
jgi:hypothetical protein